MSSPAALTPAASGLVIAALQAVLAAEHAAVYGLPVVGVTLTDATEIEHVRAAQAAHRQTRDTLMTELVALGTSPVAAQPSYRPPQKVADVVSAQRWALQLEEGCGAAYRYLLAQVATGATSGTASRRTALTGLTDAASAALYWRRRLTPNTPTQAFPGL